jgi:hypothetical protein
VSQEPAPRRLSEFVIARELAEHSCERITRAVIAELNAMEPAFLENGTGFRSLWEEVCVQVQRDTSPWWRHYEEAIRFAVDSKVEKLQPFERDAIWLLTPEGEDWDCEYEEEREPYPVFTRDIVEYLVEDWVLMEAGRWQSPATIAYIYGPYYHDE